MNTSERYVVQSAPPATQVAAASRPTRFFGALLLLIAVALALVHLAPLPLSSRFQTFTTIFLGIFIEAAPFLLAGSIVSGLIEVFVNPETMERYIPRQPILAALAGALLGFAFPVCECGVVPVTRRLYQKGLPPSVGIAFLLAAPAVNPIVLLSTYAAFGWGPILIGRFVFSVLIASVVGILFGLARREEILLPESLEVACHHSHDHDHDHTHAQESAQPPNRRQQIWRALAVSGDEFVDMGRFLILGSMLAAAMQTLVPQSTLLALGGGPVVSVIALMILAFVLSICSTVDAFLALSFVNSFTSGSILAFLVFGPMVDIKSSLMFLGVFQRRTVAYLILLPLLFTLVISVFINLNVGW